MGMTAILFSSAKLFNKLLVLLDRRPHVKSGENWQVVSLPLDVWEGLQFGIVAFPGLFSYPFSQKTFKDLYDFIHVQSLRAKTDTPGDKHLIVTNKFYYFTHTV